MFSIFATVLFVLTFVNRFNSLHRDRVMEHYIGFQKQNQKWVLNMAREYEVFFYFHLSNELAPLVLARYSDNLFWITLKAISQQLLNKNHLFYIAIKQNKYKKRALPLSPNLESHFVVSLNNFIMAVCQQVLCNIFNFCATGSIFINMQFFSHTLMNFD